MMEKRNKAVLEVLRTVTDPDDDLWLVGGYVRDLLAGKNPGSDIDLATSRNSATIATKLELAGVLGSPPVIHPKFRTAIVEILGQKVEITTFRKEIYVSGSRKPETTVATMEQDATRRDFTINALYQNLHTQKVEDPTQKGLVDLLELRVLRTPDNAHVTLNEDPLRIFRAMRFYNRGYSLAPDLQTAMAENAGRILSLSGERISEELRKMFLHPMDTVVFFQDQPFRQIWDALFIGYPPRSLGSIPSVLPTNCLQVLAILYREGDKNRYRGYLEAFLRDYKFSREEQRYALMAYDAIKFIQKEVEPVLQADPSPGQEFALQVRARQLVNIVAGHQEEMVQLISLLWPDSAYFQTRVLHSPAAGYLSPLSGFDVVQTTQVTDGPLVGFYKDFLTNLVVYGVLAEGDVYGTSVFLEELMEQV